MAKIVLGLGTSHSPMLALDAEQWRRYAQGDLKHTGLVYPPGVSMTYDEGLAHVPTAVRERDISDKVFEDQVAQCQRGIEELAKTVAEVKPDVTVIISDDQDEWFYEDNMPTFSVFWGDSVPIIPRPDTDSPRDPDVNRSIIDGYGDVAMDVPVAKELGRHLIDYMIENEFDISHFNYVKEAYGGKVGRRYPLGSGEENPLVRETKEKNQGLPHGYSFVVKRLFKNQALPILPIFENTCYPPNQPTVRRSFKFGEAIRGAIESWDSDARVAVVASGGLSHFVVDEELDWMVLNGLKDKDREALMSVPRERLYSAASETQNWIALGGALQDTDLNMELVEYVPVYRTAAGTGGGWAFARWQ